jgi:hypothetical protein
MTNDEFETICKEASAHLLFRSTSRYVEGLSKATEYELEELTIQRWRSANLIVHKQIVVHPYSVYMHIHTASKLTQAVTLSYYNGFAQSIAKQRLDKDPAIGYTTIGRML